MIYIGNNETDEYDTHKEMPTTGDGLTELNVTVSLLSQVILGVINTIAIKIVMCRSIYVCLGSGKGACPQVSDYNNYYDT